MPDALGGHLPQTFPIASFMRDRPVLPPDAKVLAVGENDAPVVFRIRDNCLGFLGHPGVKSAMVEDVIMTFDEVPDDTAETLAALREAQREIAAALGEIMVGLIEVTGLMQPRH